MVGHRRGASSVGVESDAVTLRVLAGRTGWTLFASAIFFASVTVGSVIIARLLGVEGRGIIATAVVVPTIVAYGGEFGLPVATSYLIAQRPSERASVLGTARMLALGLSVPLVLLSVGLTLALPLAHNERALGLAFSAFVPLNLFQRLHLAVLQVELRMRAYNAVRVLGSLAYVMALAALPFLGAASAGGVIGALLVGNAVWVVLGTALASGRPVLVWDGGVARRLLGYGARSHVGSVSPIDNLRIDQLLLALILPAQVLGLYVTAMTFLTANRMIGTSLGIIAFPVAARTSSPRARKPLLLLVALALGLGSVAAAGEIVFGRQLLEFVFGDEFRGAYSALVLLALASITMNARGVLADWLRGIGRPGLATLGEVASLAVLLPAFALLWNGRASGVAAAVLAASVISLVATIVLLRPKYSRTT